MYAVIRIVGQSGTSDKTEDTLEILNLDRKFSCTFVPEGESYEGMLKRAKDAVTWGEVDSDLMEKVIEKKGQKGKDTANLSPPSGGFKNSTKFTHPKGEAGYRGEDINGLLRRMV